MISRLSFTDLRYVFSIVSCDCNNYNMRSRNEGKRNFLMDRKALRASSRHSSSPSIIDLMAALCDVLTQ